MDNRPANAPSAHRGDSNPAPAGLGPVNLLLLVLVPAGFAFNPVAARALVDACGPATLTLLRWSLSGLLVGALALMRPGAERWQAPFAQLLNLAVLAAFGMGFCSAAAYIASRTTEATNIGLIYGCASALVAAWEIITGRQAPGTALIVGILTCLSGTILILTRGHPEALLALHFNPGDLWAAAGMLVFVAYTVAMRRLPARLTPLAQFTIMSIGASVATLPFAANEMLAAGLPVLDGKTLPWIAVVVLVTGVGAYLGYNISLTRNGPVLTAASLTLTPAFAAVQAVILIGERLHWYHAAAILLVVIGLMLTSYSQRAR